MVLPPPVLAGERPVAPAFAYLPPAALAVADLEPRACRWPLGRPDEAHFAFCGGLRLPGGSYCAVHARVARSGAGCPGGRA